MTDAVIMAVNSLLLPQEGSTAPLQQQLPVSGDGNTLVNQTCRVVAEIRTRACNVLATYLKDFDFAKELIQRCGSSVIDTLKSLAKDCGTGTTWQSLSEWIYPEILVSSKGTSVA